MIADIFKISALKTAGRRGCTPAAIGAGVALFIFLAAGGGAAVAAQETATVSLGRDNRQLRLALNPLEAIDRRQSLLLSDVENYALYEIEFADDPERMRGVERKILAGAPECEFDCARVKIALSEPLGYEKTYMLKVKGLVLDNKAVRPIRFEVRREAAVLPSLDNSRKKIRVRGVVPIEEAREDLVVKETVLRVTGGGDKIAAEVKTNRAKVVDSSATNELTLELDKKLSENGTYYLSVEEGLTDGAGAPVRAAGKVRVAGLPAAPLATPIDLKISTAAAFRQKPHFDLVAAFALPSPWNLDDRGVWYFEPRLLADVGLGQTKSKNSLVFSAPFKRDFALAGNAGGSRITALRPERGEVAKLPNYYGWRRTPPYRLTSVEFRAGPKIETDQRLSRINVLGSVRLDFNFSRLQSSIAERREYLVDDLGRERADQVFLKTGFRFVPFLNFDLGRKVTTEAVENKRKTVRILVPRHGVARAQIGFVNLYEWYLGSFPMSLTVEESIQYLFMPETVGVTVSDRAELRRVRGFHHLGRASLNLFLDRAKRYSFNVTYENGRAAPNFEYLNKVTTGFRLLY